MAAGNGSKTAASAALASGDRARARGDVTDEQIAARAYERFLERGGEPGHDVEDWLAAEQELRGAAGISNRPVEEEHRDQAEVPARGTPRRQPDD